MSLADWMTANGLDDETLAEKANVTRATISRLRRGKQKPGDQLAATLFSLTGGQVTPNDFYDLPELPEGCRPNSQEAA
jgi:transcriptional regulator with XRE-family HTH domain